MNLGRGRERYGWMGSHVRLLQFEYWVPIAPNYNTFPVVNCRLFALQWVGTKQQEFEVNSMQLLYYQVSVSSPCHY